MANTAFIMAGGSGTRLWPLSRAARPKQLLQLFEGKSLLRWSYERLAGLLPPEQMYIIAAEAHLDVIAADVPELPRENLIGEPCGRDTANAVGLVAALMERKDPDGVTGIFTADHVITPVDRFCEVVNRGFEVAADYPGALVTFGVTPRHPHIGFGYVQRGDRIADGVYAVRQFKEKPDLATATQYVDSGEYYWNSGMFAWRTETIQRELAEHLADSHAKLATIADAWGSPAGQRVAAETYPTLERVSIDTAVMEKARRVLVVEMACDWLDVGSWPALEFVLGTDDAGNTRALRNASLLDARDNILVSESDHLIAAIGVEGLVVVHSEDATLICRKEDAQRLKDMVAQLRTTDGERYL